MRILQNKIYPYHDDFRYLGKFSFDSMGSVRINFMNFILNAAYKLNRFDKKIKKKTYTIEGYKSKIKVDVLSPKNNKEDLPCLLYAHGGGFVFDILPYHLYACSLYALQANCKVIIPHFNLASKAPFPEGLEDCYKTFEWVLENSTKLGIRNDSFALAGDSAGGCLTASLTLLLRDRKQCSPKLQMLIYPVTSNRLNTESMEKFAHAPVWNAKNAHDSWNKYYLKGYATLPKYAAPLEEADLNDLPSAYVELAEFDCLNSEGRLYAERLSAAGVKVELNPTQGTVHGFDLNRKSSITQAAFKKRIEVLNKAFE